MSWSLLSDTILFNNKLLRLLGLSVYLPDVFGLTRVQYIKC